MARRQLGWWQRFRALPRNSITKTFAVAVTVAFTAGVLVTLTTVLLEPRQQAHVDAARAQSLLASLRSIPGFSEALDGSDTSRLDLRLVDLGTGEFVDGDADAFDEKTAAATPSTSVAIPREQDHAGIGRRAKLAAVHLIGAPDRPDLIVLPMHGLGYQSTLRVFLVLEGDLNTIAAFTVYEHGETAGLGSQIGDLAWQQGFQGKQAFDKEGRFALRIMARGATTIHDIDGIAGATRSTNGIANLLKFWLGPNGYGPFLAKLKERSKP